MRTDSTGRNGAADTADRAADHGLRVERIWRLSSSAEPELRTVGDSSFSSRRSSCSSRSAIARGKVSCNSLGWIAGGRGAARFWFWSNRSDAGKVKVAGDGREEGPAPIVGEEI